MSEDLTSNVENRTVWIVETYHWYDGGSDLEAFADEESARSQMEMDTRNKRKWKMGRMPDVRHNTEENLTVRLRKLVLK